MDKCHAPDADYLKTSDGVAITNPDVLALYHNGPYWCRIVGLETERDLEKGKIGMSEKEQRTQEIAKLIREGVAPKDIAAQFGVTVQVVYNMKRAMKEAPALPDLANIHELIDVAARLPVIKASLLASCEEIETTARYQLSLAASIREALSA